MATLADDDIIITSCGHIDNNPNYVATLTIQFHSCVAPHCLIHFMWPHKQSYNTPGSCGHTGDMTRKESHWHIGMQAKSLSSIPYNIKTLEVLAQDVSTRC